MNELEMRARIEIVLSKLRRELEQVSAFQLEGESPNVLRVIEDRTNSPAGYIGLLEVLLE